MFFMKLTRGIPRTSVPIRQASLTEWIPLLGCHLLCRDRSTGCVHTWKKGLVPAGSSGRWVARRTPYSLAVPAVGEGELGAGEVQNQKDDE